MLKLHFLNVDHGDSIVIEHEHEGTRSFGLIDSNANVDTTPKALLKLRELGATHLNFVVVTHPHADHFLGISEILAEFENRTELFYTFPIDHAHIPAMVKAVLSSLDETDDTKYGRAATDFAKMMLAGKKIAATKYGDWISPAGEASLLMPSGFYGAKFTSVLPPGRVKGKFFEAIQSGRFDLREKNANDVSMAVLIEYAGHQIILGGDGTKANWLALKKTLNRAGLSYSPSVVKLPHHGSKEDSGKSVLDFLFAQKPPNFIPIACISADGRSHPSDDVLDELVSKGVRPYCTNLATRCGAVAKSILTGGDCDPELARFLNSVATDGSIGRKQPCQGDITISITPTGELDITTEHQNLCGYRGDFDYLIAAGTPVA